MVTEPTEITARQVMSMKERQKSMITPRSCPQETKNLHYEDEYNAGADLKSKKLKSLTVTFPPSQN